jgi:hypothetical protein
MLTAEDKKKNRRIEHATWAIFLMFFGLMFIVDEKYIPDGAWMMGIGILLILLNGIRYLQTLPISHFTAGLGVVLIILGAGDYASYNVPTGALVIFVIGAFLLGNVLIKEK